MASSSPSGNSYRAIDAPVMLKTANRLAPLSRRAALRVAVEAATLEDAEALCREYADRVRELDRQG